MRRPAHLSCHRRAALIAVLGVLVMVLVAGCDRERETAPDGTLTVSVQRTTAWVRNFNPISPAITPCWPTMAGVHEPLMVFNSVTSNYVPWLAVAHAWSHGNRVLTVTLREGVRWSDGASFDADDVVFTFELLREHPAADRRGIWDSLAAVRAIDPLTVAFEFARVHVPGFDDVIVQPIVPEHVWRDIADPLGFANAHPVGTGPFTEVDHFTDRLYEIGRNPHYWQEGMPAVTALRFPALPSNDEANMGLIYGEVDWAGDFIPAIRRVFVERDPEHHHYWFPLTGGGVFLFANTTRPPLDDVRVRQAISQAIDRPLIVDVAMFRYTRPADATGLTDAYAAWRDSSAVRRGQWVQFAPDRAAAMLDAAGLPRGDDGRRRDRAGEPIRWTVTCVRGWTDWERAAEIIAEGLAAQGLDVTVQRLEFDDWFAGVTAGRFDLTIGWTLEGASPYHVYRNLMSSHTARPVGEPATSNWHRYTSVAADSILARFESVSDPAQQHELASRLQHIFVAEAPAIPLFPGPSWAAYSTHRFTGFPSPENPYADPSPNKFDRGEVLLVLTRLRPVSSPE